MYISSRNPARAAVGRRLSLAAAVLSCGSASALAGALPERPGLTGASLSAPAVVACPRHGAGFFTLPGMTTCVRLGGMARFEVNGTSPLPVGVRSRLGYLAQGRFTIDARTPSDWGTVRTFVRFDVQSRTGRAVSGNLAAAAAAFGATGIDTYGQAQKGVLLDRAFIQFNGLTAGRLTSFYDFYGHDLEIIGATPVSDPPTINLLAWTFRLGGGASLTLSAEDPTFRRTPVAFDRLYGGGSIITGGIPVAPVVVGHNASGAPVFAFIDTRQRLNVPDAIAALRFDGAWGAFQLSGALHQVNVGPFVGPLPPGIDVGAARPAARYGMAAQAGLMLNLPALAEGDRLWLQAAAARGAMSYTGANGPVGLDLAAGSSFGRINADVAEGYVGPGGRLHLSDSWSAVAAFQHYWRHDLSQSVFAGVSGVSFGPGLPAGFGVPGGFPRHFSGNVTKSVGTGLAWSPVEDLTIAAEVAWVGTHQRRPGPDLRPRPVAAFVHSDNGWIGKVRVQRSF